MCNLRRWPGHKAVTWGGSVIVGNYIILMIFSVLSQNLSPASLIGTNKLQKAYEITLLSVYSLSV
jgi:hypothetical protein